MPTTLWVTGPASQIRTLPGPPASSSHPPSQGSWNNPPEYAHGWYRGSSCRKMAEAVDHTQVPPACSLTRTASRKKKKKKILFVPYPNQASAAQHRVVSVTCPPTRLTLQQRHSERGQASEQNACLRVSSHSSANTELGDGKTQSEVQCPSLNSHSAPQLTQGRTPMTGLAAGDFQPEPQTTPPQHTCTRARSAPFPLPQDVP